MRDVGEGFGVTRSTSRSISSCAFCHTSSFLKSDMRNSEALSSMLHQRVLPLRIDHSRVIRAGSALFDLRENGLDLFNDRLDLAASLAGDIHRVLEIPLELGDAGEKITQNLGVC